VEPFAELVKRARVGEPRTPIFSTATGRLLTPGEATDPMYWARHMRVTVRFMEALRALWADPSRILLEVGPRGTSATLARQIATDRARQVAIASLGDKTETEWSSVIDAVGQLWLGGASIDWEAFQAIGRRKLVSLPSYPFARDRHFVDPRGARVGAGPSAAVARAPAATQGHANGVTAPAVPGPSNGAASGIVPEEAEADVVVQVVAAQLQLMEAQLEALRALQGTDGEEKP
jgi:acyl transferase domain-containing protein